MAAGQKKVVIRSFTASLHWGYLPQSDFLRGDGVSLMGVDGRVNPIALNEIKTIAYVRDFNLDDVVDPERIGRRTFLARPRGDGLWLRLTFRDDDTLEGLANVDVGFADSLVKDHGFLLTPPDTRGNTQRVFVPRSALRSIEALGYVTAPSKRATKRTAVDEGQSSLFGEPVE